MKFTKMHGCGNDYVYVNLFEEKIADPAKVSIAVSDRHFGIGSDGLITIGPSDIADFRMRIYNADGYQQCKRYDEDYERDVYDLFVENDPCEEKTCGYRALLLWPARRNIENTQTFAGLASWIFFGARECSG